MNSLQQAEYELLQKAVQICEKNQITYYLVCGSALGAIKYNGFIPWDDDIDIALCRKDYNRFIQIAEQEMDTDVFVQNHNSCKEIPFIYTKLRNQKTTFIEKTVSKMDISHGVYIDVFPLDGYPDNKIKAFIFEFKKKIVWRLLSLLYYRNSTYKNIVTAPISFMVKPFRVKLVNYYEKIISAYPCEKSKLWCNFGNSPSKSEYADKSQYGKGGVAVFEGMNAYVPEKFDEYLTQKYGDWRTDLPEEEQIGHHYADIVDIERPYTDYIIKLSNGKIRLKTSNELLSEGIEPPEGYEY